MAKKFAINPATKRATLKAQLKSLQAAYKKAYKASNAALAIEHKIDAQVRKVEDQLEAA